MAMATAPAFPLAPVCHATDVAAPQAAEGARPAHLVPVGAGEAVPLPTEAGVLQMGRAETCDVKIDAMEVSRKHAKVERREDGTLWVTSQGRANPLLLNGKVLHADKGPMQLKHDDVIGVQLTDATREFRISMPAPFVVEEDEDCTVCLKDIPSLAAKSPGSARKRPALADTSNVNVGAAPAPKAPVPPPRPLAAMDFGSELRARVEKRKEAPVALLSPRAKRLANPPSESKNVLGNTAFVPDAAALLAARQGLKNNAEKLPTKPAPVENASAAKSPGRRTSLFSHLQQGMALKFQAMNDQEDDDEQDEPAPAAAATPVSQRRASRRISASAKKAAAVQPQQEEEVDEQDEPAPAAAATPMSQRRASRRISASAKKAAAVQPQQEEEVDEQDEPAPAAAATPMSQRRASRRISASAKKAAAVQPQQEEASPEEKQAHAASSAKPRRAVTFAASIDEGDATPEIGRDAGARSVVARIATPGCAPTQVSEPSPTFVTPGGTRCVQPEPGKTRAGNVAAALAAAAPQSTGRSKAPGAEMKGKVPAIYFEDEGDMEEQAAEAPTPAAPAYTPGRQARAQARRIVYEAPPAMPAPPPPEPLNAHIRFTSPASVAPPRSEDIAAPVPSEGPACAIAEEDHLVAGDTPACRRQASCVAGAQALSEDMALPEDATENEALDALGEAMEVGFERAGERPISARAQRAMTHIQRAKNAARASGLHKDSGLLEMQRGLTHAHRLAQTLAAENRALKALVENERGRRIAAEEAARNERGRRIAAEEAARDSCDALQMSAPAAELTLAQDKAVAEDEHVAEEAMVTGDQPVADELDVEEQPMEQDHAVADLAPMENVDTVAEEAHVDEEVGAAAQDEPMEECVLDTDAEPVAEDEPVAEEAPIAEEEEPIEMVVAPVPVDEEESEAEEQPVVAVAEEEPAAEEALAAAEEPVAAVAEEEPAAEEEPEAEKAKAAEAPEVEEEEEEEADVEEEEVACEICGSADEGDVLLLCDGCDKGFHKKCAGVRRVPKGDWFCACCKEEKQAAAAPRRTTRARK